MEFNLKKLAFKKELEAKSFPNGGLNTALPENKIGDDESAEILNFRLKNGALTLRQGLREKITLDYGKIIDIYPKNAKPLLLSRIYPLNNMAEERRGIYIAAEKAILYYDGTAINPVLKLTEENGKTTSSVPELTLTSGTLIPTGSAKTETFTLGGVTYTVQGENILFVGSGKFFLISPKHDTTVEDKVSVIPTLSEVVPKVPLLYENCNARGEGERVGAHNILTDEAMQYFTTDNTSLKYFLCDCDLTDDPVKVDYMVESGMEYEYIFQTNDFGMIDDTIKITLDRRDGFLKFSAPLCDAKAAGMVSNLKVYYKKASKLRESFLNCSCGEWFNGGAKSSSGNGRLFVSGNDRDPNRIFCSVNNDPSYFPDDAYFLVGRPNEKVTALKTSGNYMIIFMESSLFSLNFVQLSNAADFIIKEISSLVGCEVPKTIARIENDIVFLERNKVYSLTPSKISTSKALRVISQKIENELSKTSDADYLTSSAAFDGKDYLLFMGQFAFALSTTKNDFSPSEGKVAWFLYKLPYALKNAFAMVDGICAASGDDKTIYQFSEDATDDCGVVFDAYLFSKAIDFNIFDFYKRITQAEVAAKGDADAFFDFVLKIDGEENIMTVTLEKGDGSEKNFVFRPMYNRASGVKIGVRRREDSLKSFSIDGLSVRALKSSPQR